jgi:hypothetical protein
VDPFGGEPFEGEGIAQAGDGAVGGEAGGDGMGRTEGGKGQGRSDVVGEVADVGVGDALEGAAAEGRGGEEGGGGGGGGAEEAEGGAGGRDVGREEAGEAGEVGERGGEGDGVHMEGSRGMSGHGEAGGAGGGRPCGGTHGATEEGGVSPRSQAPGADALSCPTAAEEEEDARDDSVREGPLLSPTRHAAPAPPPRSETLRAQTDLNLLRVEEESERDRFRHLQVCERAFSKNCLRPCPKGGLRARALLVCGDDD